MLAFRMAVNPGPAAARDAWELGNQTFNNFLPTFTVSYPSESRLADTPLVTTCADMRRIEGEDIVLKGLPVGMSLCAADPDEIIFVYTSGAIDGASGAAAADRIIALMLAQ